MQRRSVDFRSPTRRSGNDVVLRDLRGSTSRQHLVVAERLRHAVELDEGVALMLAARSRSSRWAIRLSVKRASGIVRRTKKHGGDV